MKIIEWEREIESLEMGEVTEILKAFDTLLEWKAFAREYKGHGLELLRTVIANVVERNLE